MGKRRTALGRGLDALIPNREREGVRDLSLDDIVPSRSQPRVRFDEARLAELADSITLHGLLQPLIVGPPDEHGKHPLIVGERRWQAARIAGLERVPVVERELEEPQSMEVALIENLQREDLDPLEEAAAFDRLVKDYGLTQEEVATRLGRSRSSIANSLRLLSLPSNVRQALIDGHITEGHARALLGLSESQSIDALLKRVIDAGLSVRETERLVATLRGNRLPVPRPREQSEDVRRLEDQLRASLGTKVTVHKGRKLGRIVIEYYSDEDLQTLLERLLDEE